MKQEYVALAKKIIEGSLPTVERVALEDQLIEMAYQMTNGYDLKPEDFDDLIREKRVKNGMLKPTGDLKLWFKNKLEEEIKEFLAATKKENIVEKLGDILEVVETYTARF